MGENINREEEGILILVYSYFHPPIHSLDRRTQTLFSEGSRCMAMHVPGSKPETISEKPHGVCTDKHSVVGRVC